VHGHTNTGIKKIEKKYEEPKNNVGHLTHNNKKNTTGKTVGKFIVAGSFFLSVERAAAKAAKKERHQQLKMLSCICSTFLHPSPSRHPLPSLSAHPIAISLYWHVYRWFIECRNSGTSTEIGDFWPG